MKDESSRVEQSAEYYQNSFKVLEQHYLEEKEKSDQQIKDLKGQNQVLELELVNCQNELADCVEKCQDVEHKWHQVELIRSTAQQAACQSDFKGEDIQYLMDQNKQIFKENDQINKDIQILINSYDKFKDESNQIQAQLRTKIISI